MQPTRNGCSARPLSRSGHFNSACALSELRDRHSIRSGRVSCVEPIECVLLKVQVRDVGTTTLILSRIVGLGLAVIASCHAGECAGTFDLVDFQRLGFLAAPSRDREVLLNNKIDGLEFRNGAFWVRIYTQSGVRTAKISAANHQIVEIGPLRSPEAVATDPAVQERVRHQLREQYARKQQQNMPTILGNARLRGDTKGDLFVDKPQGSQRIYTVSPHCLDNREITARSLAGYYFFLDENHIGVWDCNKLKIISKTGQKEYTLPLHYASAKITRGKSLFATLEPAWTFWGHLIPAPEDSSRLQVFCFSTGKRLVSDEWSAANGDNLVLSDDDRTVALPSRSAIRFYHLEPKSCQN